MADDTATISFSNDLFTDARGDTATYTGSFNVDYTTRTYSGNFKVKGDGLGASGSFSGNLGVSGSTYTISGANFTLRYTGEQPTTAYAEFVANNNEDYKTSLNPSGQQNQSVSTSGGSSSGGTGTTGGGTGSTGGGTGTTGGGDRTATISFTNDLFTDKRGDRATYTGSFNVDYTTGTYSGKVKVKGNGLGAGLSISGHLAVNGSTYTIAGANFTLSYTGQQPTTAYAEFVANNNEDYKTSLNPQGQRNQAVMSSGNASTTQAARVASPDSTAATDATALDRVTTVAGPGMVRDGGEGAGTFVFQPGHGADLLAGFKLDGSDHDTLSFAGSDFGDSIADVLRHTRDAGNGTVITDPATGDRVRLAGITKSDLAHNRSDFSFF